MLDQDAGKHTLEAGFWVGPFFVEPQALRISRGEDEARVEPKVMEVLVCLARHRGKTVSKERFMEEVWQETVVTEDSLLRCISELRKVFRDEPREPRYIETIRKRGYRLIAPVASAPEETGTAFLNDGKDRSRVHEPLRSSLPDGREPAGRPHVWIWVAALLLLSAGGLFGLRHFFKTNALVPLKTIPFTSFPGEETDPSLSPDGDRIAFVWNGGGGGTFDIYVQQVGVATPVRVTTNAADDGRPAWSPDGLQLAFVRETDGAYALYLVPAVGGTERQLVDLRARAVEAIAWSPDGKTLALAVQQAPHEAFGIALLSLETLAMRPLTYPPSDYLGDIEVAFSPDGRTLAFVRSVVEKVEDLYVMPVEGGAAKRVTFDHAAVTGLDWMPDGKRLLYTSDREGSSALWIVPVSGGAPRWVPASSEGSGIFQPTVARRQGRMAFVQRSLETNIWALNPGAEREEDAERRLISSTRWDSNPNLSPTGSRIAFVSNRSGNYEVWICDGDGTHPLQLTNFDGPFTSTPRWSPDGKQIAFVAREAGSVDLYVLDVTGGSPRRLTTADSNDRAPSWSRDGQWVYFASNRSDTWEIWKIPSDGGTATRVTENGGYGAAEAPDGRALYYVKRDAPGIWRRPIAGGPETLVVEDLQPYDWGNWVVGDEGLYWIRRPAEGPVLAFYRFETGAVTPVAVLHDVPKHPALSVSSDGRHVLYTRIDRSESDILLVEGFQ